ncbi:hypothetical protein SY83_06175 [Paenibacillus swuensis]|uniref:N-acetyltransferase domain-containing protein n=1 Tax=Paenibacillus swuensis TaxID=1178515 RepID=A0A172TGN1_9BACL|nr:GNAT family protein [Paenibacillus swuensis]ANE45943.1 hypothetical protein SY83_06175 [Paenibacillus swuensis]
MHITHPDSPESYTLRPMTVEDAETVAAWRYLPPYNVYNNPAWEDMLASSFEFADAEIRAEQYRSVVNGNGTLIGFAQFFPLEGWTRLGLGLHPDRCGQGSGVHFVHAIVAYARHLSPENSIDLEVSTWNNRAIRTYLKAGFEITDSYERLTPTGKGMFHCMVCTGNGTQEDNDT